MRPGFLTAIGRDVGAALGQVADALKALDAEDAEVAISAFLSSGFLVIFDWSSRQRIQEDAESWLRAHKSEFRSPIPEFLGEVARSVAIRAHFEPGACFQADPKVFSLPQVLSVADGEFLFPDKMIERLAPISEWSTQIRIVDRYFLADPDKDEKTIWIQEFLSKLTNTLDRGEGETKVLEFVCQSAEHSRGNTRRLVERYLNEAPSAVKIVPHIALGDGRFNLHDRAIQFSRDGNNLKRSFSIGSGPSSWLARRGISLHRIGAGTFEKIWNSAIYTTANTPGL
jgi:hypothetical protein